MRFHTVVVVVAALCAVLLTTIVRATLPAPNVLLPFDAAGPNLAQNIGLTSSIHFTPNLPGLGVSFASSTKSGIPGSVGVLQLGGGSLVAVDNSTLALLPRGSSYTFSVWIRPVTLFKVAHTIIARGNELTSAVSFVLSVSSTGSLAGSAGGSAVRSEPGLISANTWTMVSLTNGLNTTDGQWYFAVYANGTLVGRARSGTSTSQNAVTIGARRSSAGELFLSFFGYMDHFMYFSSRLTSAEIAELYQSLLPISSTPQPSSSPSQSVVPSVSNTPAETPSSSRTSSVTISVTASSTESVTSSPSVTASTSDSPTVSRTQSVSRSLSATGSISRSISLSTSLSSTSTREPSVSASETRTSSLTPSSSSSISQSSSISRSASMSRSLSNTASVSISVTSSISVSPTASPTPWYGDTDRDSIKDNVDNCVSIFNTEQTDIDSDGIGDACDDCPTVSRISYGSTSNPATSCLQILTQVTAAGCSAPASGLYTLNITVPSTGPILLTVYCDMSLRGGGWTLLAQTTESRLSTADRTLIRSANWTTSTVTGYGNPDLSVAPSYWMPLQYWTALTTRFPYNQLIDDTSAGTTATLTHVRIGDASTQYTLSYQAEDSLKGDEDVVLNGMKFTTLDSDNDLSSGMNCASGNVGLNGPFWYNACRQTSMLHSSGLLYGLSVNPGDSSPIVVSYLRLYFREMSGSTVSTCRELNKIYGTNTPGYYTFTAPSTSTTYQAYCDFDADGTSWTRLARLSTRERSFITADLALVQNSTFNTYSQTGFRSTSPNDISAFTTEWIPLSVWNSLTSTFPTNQVQERNNLGLAPNSLSCAFNNVNVRNAANDHGWSSSSWSSSCSQSPLATASAVAFTTWDQDHDASGTSNCADLATRTGGFWYSSPTCAQVSQLSAAGEILSVRNDSTPVPLQWRSFHFQENTTRYYQSCKQIQTASGSTAPSGVYTIILGGNLVSVWCDMSWNGGGWTLLAKTIRTSSSSLTTLQRDTIRKGDAQTYQSDGYGDPSDSVSPIYWMPLRLWRALTVYFPSNTVIEYNSEGIGCTMTGFSLGSGASTKPYLLNYGSGTSACTGILSTAKGLRGFTTHDRDYDVFGTNCAKDNVGYNGGWWYQNCFQNSMLHSNGNLYPFSRNASGATLTFLKIFFREA